MIKQYLVIAIGVFVLQSCSGTKALVSTDTITPTQVVVDLVNVNDDKVEVTINPGEFKDESIQFFIPKTVPGTYSTDDYGRLIENLKAYDYNGALLDYIQIGDNTYSFPEAKKLDKITYFVNDSYDIEGELGIFSPSGTNIDEESFILNLHGFVGYFENQKENPFSILLKTPTDMFISSALPHQPVDIEDPTYSLNQFSASRYFQVIDNPIMVTKTAPSEFMIGDMKVVVDVFSPNDTFTASGIQPNLETMMQAQKNYLGAINDTPLYAILVYLSDMENLDARGFGALEHHTSTIVVLPEAMPVDYFNETMTDIVSHEFFHTLTPLNVHSEEIHYFDYNDPEMSKHLWMYEGVTEYFANHFQIHEGLISEQDFYDRMLGKISNAKKYADTMPFTEMSENILEEPYKDQYINVYEKGALIAMALDIQLRELSGGTSGILDLMGKLSEKYGKEQPFKDDDLIPTIVSLTYPEIQDFFDTYVSGSTPIPYNDFFAKVGLETGVVQSETNMWLKDMEIPFIDVNQETSEIFYPGGLTNTMIDKIGFQPGDIIKEVNGQEISLETINNLIVGSMGWQVGDPIEMVVNRDGAPTTLNAIYEVPMMEQQTIQPIDLPADDERVMLRNAWLFSK